MATFTAIKNATQSRGAMQGALNYIRRKDKTLWGDRQLVSGWNCVAQSAYDEMMTTKRQQGKTDGRMFYQFVQSFHPEEAVTPEEVHAIGLELAQRLFPDFEVVVATHVDADHLHNHLIVNSVSCTDGHKLHQNAADLQRQRQISDQICEAHGLTVLTPPKQRTRKKQMRPGEYRSAVKGESWKFQLINTIDLCMRKAKTRAEFIREMEGWGYQARWEPTRKAITYTTPKGKKCRDDRLHDKRYRKEVMEREFLIREAILFARIEEIEYTGGAANGLSHGGTMGRIAGSAGRPTPSAGGPEQHHEVSAVHNADDGRPVGETDAGAGGYPPAAPTGWEEERVAAFSAEDTPAHAQSGLAVGHSSLGSISNSLVRLGHALERDQPPAPTAPVTGHGDRKALAKERAKKIAQGHRPEDREETPTWQHKM